MKTTDGTDEKKDGDGATLPTSTSKESSSEDRVVELENQLKTLLDAGLRGDKAGLASAWDRLRANAVQIVVMAILSSCVAAFTLAKDSISDWWKGKNSSSLIELKKIAERDVRIRELLIQLRLRLNADRVYVCLIHNGTTAPDGTNLQRFSCQYEVQREGVSSEQDRMQDLPISNIAELLKCFASQVPDKDPTYSKIDDLPNGNAFKALMRGRGAWAFCAASLRTGSDTLIGYIGVDWTHVPVSGAPVADDAKRETQQSTEMLTYLLSQKGK